MKQKRILSLFLALLLVFQLAPAAMAAPEDGAETGPAITGIEIIRAAGSANITLNAGEEAALLIAAVYTRDLQLQETKAAEVSPGEGTVLLTFSESFRDGPVYIKAMLVDPETYAPLCEARTEYTESQATTVDDFDPALVMNFDERKDENFAVLAQGVVPLYAGTDFGRFETEDEVSFTVYGISDAALRRLGPDVKAVLFDGDNSYPVSVDSVERFTGGAVLRGAEPDTEEGENLDLAAFFDYITFDQEIEELDTSEMEYADGVEPAESPPADGGRRHGRHHSLSRWVPACHGHQDLPY